MADSPTPDAPYESAFGPSATRMREVAAERGYDLQTSEGRARASRVAQGFPEHLEDKVTIAAIAALAARGTKAAS